jgi:hypothetical protein
MDVALIHLSSWLSSLPAKLPAVLCEAQWKKVQDLLKTQGFSVKLDMSFGGLSTVTTYDYCESDGRRDDKLPVGDNFPTILLHVSNYM